MTKDLAYYTDKFSSLHTMMKKGKPAPHKALLLLSVIDLIERGVIKSSHFTLSDELIRQFKANTQRLLGESLLFSPTINYPFYHLRSEGFWELVASPGSDIEKISNYSLPSLRKNVAFVRIDTELFKLLQDPSTRARLRVTLISKYLQNQPTIINKIPTVLLPLALLASFIA